MHKKIVLIGAGSATFGPGMLGDLFRSPVLAGSLIVLHDINPQALRQVHTLSRDFLNAHQLAFELSATTSRQEALQDADFCINSIEVGNRFELWEQDWRIPQQYGNRQIFGENGGPGGLFHALRIIPPILDICADIQRICPQAYVLNLSNPMSRICLAVKRRFPDLRFIGLCHEIANLPDMLHGILKTPFAELTTKTGGLNHFTVLLDARYKQTGQDAYPEVRRNAAAYLATLPELTDVLRESHGQTEEPARFQGRQWADRWLIKAVFEKFGYLPVTMDSHFGEYIQWAAEVADHQSILDFYTWYKEWSFTHVPQIKPEGTESVERTVPIIEAIVTDSKSEELAVNIMNDGFIDNLPRDLVVEIPAMVDRNGVHGVCLGRLPAGIAGLLMNQVAVHDLTVEAVLHKSRDLALQALLVDPVVDSLRGAEQMLETILKRQQAYLGYLR